MLKKLNEIRWGIIGCGNVVKNKSGGAFTSLGKAVSVEWRPEVRIRLENMRGTTIFHFLYD